jgi:DNA primase
MKYSIPPNCIEAWVSRYFECKRRKNGQEILICNPFDDDNKFKFNINTVKGICHDWRPGHQENDGPFINFVMKYRNLGFRDALKEICGDDIDIKDIIKKESAKDVTEDKTINDIELPKSAKQFNGIGGLIEKMAIQYLSSRGIDNDKIQKYKLHYDVGSVIFPYFEYDAIVYWQKRSIGEKRFEFPDLNTFGVGKEMFIYGFDQCERDMPMYVCESIIDSITLGDNAVATGGASMSIQQCKKIKAILPSKVILTPDRDEAGVLSVLKNTALIKSILDIDVLFCVPPNNFKDWNDMRNNDPVAYILKNAKTVNPVNINIVVSKVL